MERGADLLSQVVPCLLPVIAAGPARSPPSASGCRVAGEQLLLIYISRGILMVMSFCLSLAPSAVRPGCQGSVAEEHVMRPYLSFPLCSAVFAVCFPVSLCSGTDSQRV